MLLGVVYLGSARAMHYTAYITAICTLIVPHCHIEDNNEMHLSTPVT